MSQVKICSLIKDLTGQKFGLLTAIKYSHSHKRKAYWLCKCDCGNECVRVGSQMSYGKVRSCGCLAYANHRTHGYSQRRIYNIWHCMVSRCTDPTNGRYKDYGGRGITVCSRWLEFENFLSDMGHPPNGYQINRIDNDGDYMSNNCEWATPSENARNKRTSKLTADDVSVIKHYLLYGSHRNKDIAEMFGVHRNTISGIKRGVIWDDIGPIAA